MAKSQAVVNAVEPVLNFFQIAQQRMQYWVRKSAHFLEFSLLGILWHWSLRCWMEKIWQSAFLSLGFSFLTACVDEGIQIFTNRTSQLQDVMIDSLGALAGIVLFTVILLMFRTIKRENL